MTEVGCGEANWRFGMSVSRGVGCTERGPRLRVGLSPTEPQEGQRDLEEVDDSRWKSILVFVYVYLLMYIVNGVYNFKFITVCKCSKNQPRYRFKCKIKHYVAKYSYETGN